MVLPIIVGIGVTVFALTTKSTVAAYRKFIHLTPAMIASLNNIRIDDPLNSSTSIFKDGKPHPDAAHHQFLRSKFPNTGFGDKMTEQEALLIMGIEANDIEKLNKMILKNRYRKLMVMNHPDRHGSQYLTQKINQAKDVLDKSYLFRK